MNKAPMWIFFDNLVLEYANCYGQSCEGLLIKEFKKYLSNLAKTSKIIILTCKDTSDIEKWFVKNKLKQYIYSIENPIFK